ncbi:hypothetical protein [Spongiactinospora sp. TRM90649]|uniref:hypothetical protein n=1 Tax=Spongiactinospora sp. TRM90649 TaxID=3031114 RepID=UPI0023F8E0AF|nr:hypothetical protein [Spongiactinospora sp. TRM90649]MDF5755771.1 hypothetical protein [Spongiactinospora sp. TRM90649]
MICLGGTRTVAMALLAVALTAACGPISEGHHPPGSSHATASGPAGEELPLANIAVRDGRVAPPPGRLEVKVGERVSLSVTSDRADEVHVHGFDVGGKLVPGKPLTVTFVADRTGVFEVETHESGLLLTQLAVR